MTTATLGDVRLEKLFDATDSNGDGTVEWSDYEKIVDRYLKGFNADKNSREAHALRAVHQMYFAELVRHAHGKDRLTKPEYVAAVQSLAMDTSRFNMVEGLPHAIFDVIDTDDDNGISRAEFQKFLKVWDVTDPSAMETFDRLDTDGDGTISRQEYIRSWREFFYSPDPNAPGAFYLGKVN